jgi:hypothetical protein
MQIEIGNRSLMNNNYMKSLCDNFTVAPGDDVMLFTRRYLTMICEASDKYTMEEIMDLHSYSQGCPSESFELQSVTSFILECLALDNETGYANASHTLHTIGTTIPSAYKHDGGVVFEGILYGLQRDFEDLPLLNTSTSRWRLERLGK